MASLLTWLVYLLILIIIIHCSDSTKSSIPINMELKAKANSPEYLKSLMFSNKESAIIKIMELLPYIKRGNTQSKIVIMKVLPVLFSFSEVNNKHHMICSALIRKIKSHPSFIEEKRLLNGWETRFKKFCGLEWAKNEKENQFANNRSLYMPGTDITDVIGYSELDLFLSFHKWLKHHKLHKYLYFFANLSYAEIKTICDEQTIRFFEKKIDLHPMTDGARKAILRKLAELDQRVTRLEVFSKMEYFTSVSKVERAIYEMKAILKTPIRRNFEFSGDNIPTLLVTAIQTVIRTILKLTKNELIQVYDSAISLLKLAWGCSFFEMDVKKKINAWQSILHTRKRSCSRKKIHQYHDVYAIHFDLEIGIKAITRYLENCILQDDM